MQLAGVAHSKLASSAISLLNHVLASNAWSQVRCYQLLFAVLMWLPMPSHITGITSRG